ncbi:MAG: hypothetical protein MZV63_04955 [Marinilabiliales bacterium]|nr:hypothetical protein [Marinilabiliales bacterium]
MTKEVKSSRSITFLLDLTLLLIQTRWLKQAKFLPRYHVLSENRVISPVVCHGLPNSLKHVTLRTRQLFLKLTVKLHSEKLKEVTGRSSIKSKTGEMKKYLVPLSKQILVQENDYVKAGIPLSDGAITPSDILAIKGPTKVQEYIVNEIQEVYRLQGVKINDKHFEIIVRQMMRKVEIVDPGDTKFLERQVVDKLEFMDENDWIYGKKVIIDGR